MHLRFSSEMDPSLLDLVDPPHVLVRVQHAVFPLNQTLAIR